MKDFFSPNGRIYGPITPVRLMENAHISLGAKSLYAVLCSCTEEGCYSCRISQGQLGQKMGLSPRRVQGYLKELLGLGLLQVKQDEPGGPLTYIFLKSDLLGDLAENLNADEGTTEQAGGSTECVVPPTKTADPFKDLNGLINNIIKLIKNPPYPPQAQTAPERVASTFSGSSSANSTTPRTRSRRLSPGEAERAEKAFLRVWEIFPRKDAEEAAKNVWLKLWRLNELPGVDELIQKIKFLKTSDPKWERGFSPYLVTWLQKNGWRDVDLTSPRQATCIVQPSFPKEETALYRDYYKKLEAETRRKNEERRTQENKAPERWRILAQGILSSFGNNQVAAI